MTPLSEVDDPSKVRDALIDQLAYLIDEVEALKGIVDVVPKSIREGRPQAEEFSIKEMYGVLAVLNETVYPKRLKRIAASADELPVFEPVDERALAEAEDWNDISLHDILDRIVAARRELVTVFEALDGKAWTATGQFGEDERDVYEFAYDIVQADASYLQDVSQRLHHSNLTGRDKDLPK